MSQPPIHSIATYGPMSLEDKEVLAAFKMHSFPNSSTFTVRCSWMYLHASLGEQGVGWGGNRMEEGMRGEKGGMNRERREGETERI